jgi:hypothetical protein
MRIAFFNKKKPQNAAFNNIISQYYKINLIPKFTSIKLNPKEVVPKASPPFGLTALYPNCPKVASLELIKTDISYLKILLISIKPD